MSLTVPRFGCSATQPVHFASSQKARHLPAMLLTGVLATTGLHSVDTPADALPEAPQKKLDCSNQVNAQACWVLGHELVKQALLQEYANAHGCTAKSNPLDCFSQGYEAANGQTFPDRHKPDGSVNWQGPLPMVFWFAVGAVVSALGIARKN